LEALIKLYHFFNEGKAKQLMLGATTKDVIPDLLEAIKLKGLAIHKIADLLSEQARAAGQTILNQNDQDILVVLKQLDYIPQLESKIDDLHKDFLKQMNSMTW